MQFTWEPKHIGEEEEERREMTPRAETKVTNRVLRTLHAQEKQEGNKAPLWRGIWYQHTSDHIDLTRGTMGLPACIYWLPHLALTESPWVFSTVLFPWNAKDSSWASRSCSCKVACSRKFSLPPCSPLGIQAELFLPNQHLVKIIWASEPCHHGLWGPASLPTIL